METILHSLEASLFANFLRDSNWVLPVLEVCHYLGHSVAVGTILLLDFRLLGLAKHLSIGTLSRFIIPCTVGGLLLAVVSGMAVFSHNAVEFWASPALGFKLAVIGLALVNVAVFHFGVYRRVAEWDKDTQAPLAARTAAALSILCWLSVIISGRLIAYL